MDWMLVVVAVLVAQVLALSGAWLGLSAGLRALNVVAVKRTSVEPAGRPGY